MGVVKNDEGAPAQEVMPSAMEGEKDAIVQLLHSHVYILEHYRKEPELAGLEEAADAIIAALSTPPRAAPPVPSGQTRAAIIEECAKVADAQVHTFLSPQYASNQPFGSICERFACEEVAKAIRALSSTEETNG